MAILILLTPGRLVDRVRGESSRDVLVSVSHGTDKGREVRFYPSGNGGFGFVSSTRAILGGGQENFAGDLRCFHIMILY